MRITYDKQAEAVYIYTGFKEKPVLKTVALTDNLIIDLGKWGIPVGIECLSCGPNSTFSQFLLRKGLCNIL